MDLPAPNVRTLSTTVQALRFIDIHEVSIIGFFDEADQEGPAGFANFISSTQGNLDSGFGVVTSPSVHNAFKISTTPKIVMFKKDEPTVTFQGNSSNLSKLKAWVATNGNILVRHMDAQKLSDISSSEIPVTLFFYANAAQGNEIKQMLQDLAPEFTDVLLFYLASIDNFQAIAQQFGLDTKDDRLVVLYPPKGHHFIMPANVSLTIDNIRDFLNEYLADRVQRSLRSQPPPKETFTPGTVQVTVANTLMEVIGDAKKDVLLELCQPGVSECPLLSNIINQVARATKNVTTLKVARINVELNEVTAFFDIPHVPLLLFFKAQNKTALSYSGVATPGKILEYISTSATHTFEIQEEMTAEFDPIVEEEPNESQSKLKNIEEQAMAHVANTLHGMGNTI